MPGTTTNMQMKGQKAVKKPSYGNAGLMAEAKTLRQKIQGYHARAMTQVAIPLAEARLASRNNRVFGGGWEELTEEATHRPSA